ncbi:M20/M25/M40 family metallo-hydrolase [candidate division KSB1 bacterium]
MKKTLILGVCILLVASLQVPAQVTTSGERAFEHIEYLASDDFKGRKSGTPEYQRAAEYVAEKMMEYGLQPGAGGGSWFQEVPFRNWSNYIQPIRLEMTSPKRHAFLPGGGYDFSPAGGTGSGKVKGKLVFAGYGIVSDTDNWNDYADLDVKDKIVLIVPGAPPSMQETFSREVVSADYKRDTAINKGAKGVIFMSVGGGRGASMRRACPEGFVAMSANETLLNQVFYLSNLSWRSLISKTIREQRSFTAELDVEVEMEAHFIREPRTAPNVIGIIPGTDPQLKDEYLIIGGHLDHMGIGIDGFVYNGADDDASGVAVVLEVARALKANNFRPKRTVVFCAWAGEEMGLVGSSYYVDNPVYPISKTALYMNMDMVGTGDLEMYIGGMWEFSDFYDIVKRDMKDKFKDKLRYRLKYRGSDHTAFIGAGVTCISLRSGGLLSREIDDEHPEYHRAGDMPNTIDIEALDAAAEYHYDIIYNLANSNENLLDPIHHIHFVHKDATIVDLHCDTAMRLGEGEDITRDNPEGHIDIPKLKQGAVDLQVFACYNAPPQNETEKLTAAKKVFNMIDDVHTFIGENPDDLALVTSYGDLSAERSTGRVGILIGIEGGYAIENDLSLLRTFHKLGVRLMTLTHWTRTDWADASGDERAELGGLTVFGEEVVREMNRLGMIIDVSHVHDETFRDVIRISEDPVVASHSCCRDISDHFRNMTDDMLKALAENGGMIGINYSPGFLNAENQKKIDALREEIAEKHGMPVDRFELQRADPQKRAAFEAEFNRKAEELRNTLPVVDVKTVVDHIDRVVRVTGSADHVGLGSDFDGISATPVGLEHTGRIVNITKELFARGYSEGDIAKILGGNFIRIFRQVCDR